MQHEASVSKVSAEQIKTLAGKYIHPDGLTVIVVGEAKEIEPALEKLGPVTVYDTDLKVKTAP